MISAIIVAGGKGLRMGANIKKQYLMIGDMPILSRTLFSFDQCPQVDRIFLVVPEEDLTFCLEKIVTPFNFKTDIQVIAGGEERQVSVYNGLTAAKGSEIVLIHDGVRPFISVPQIESCINTTRSTGACILATPAFDTLKNVDENHVITGTPDRSNVWLAQTPQAFLYDLILKSHEHAVKCHYQGTDDASLVEYYGGMVTVLPGSRHNIKITTKEDVELAKAILSIMDKR